jgi:hypothetical protein
LESWIAPSNDDAELHDWAWREIMALRTIVWLEVLMAYAVKRQWRLELHGFTLTLVNHHAMW